MHGKEQWAPDTRQAELTAQATVQISHQYALISVAESSHGAACLGERRVGEPRGNGLQRKEDDMAEQVVAGSDVTSGTYRCTTCGKEITTPSVESLPPCPDCNGTTFEVVRGGDTSADD